MKLTQSASHLSSLTYLHPRAVMPSSQEILDWQKRKEYTVPGTCNSSEQCKGFETIYEKGRVEMRTEMSHSSLSPVNREISMALSLTKPRTPGSVRYRTSPPTCSVLLSSFGSSSTILPDNDGDPRKLVHKVSDRIKGNFDAVVSF